MTEPTGPSRRTVMRAGAWSVPAIAAAIATPAAAASGPDLTHLITVTGAMIITPTPATPDGFALNFNAGSTTFDVSNLFSTPAGDAQCVDLQPCGPFDWLYSWQVTSSGSVPDILAFTSNANVSVVTVDNAAWGFDSTCSIHVTAYSIARYPPADYVIHFVVSDGG